MSIQESNQWISNVYQGFVHIKKTCQNRKQGKNRTT